MPQMMPLNWLMLFSFFSIMLMLFNVLNYYVPFKKSTNLMKIKTLTKTLNWKW
uniref:ATP synthase complex subunit 8 n=1 Tax=Stagmatoptera biocellata TaxID=1603019 RepID=A0A8F4PMJ9_9NEOP|nr:ATP synthase F0 subunit 8 [Stagmatoptera biocellata]